MCMCDPLHKTLQNKFSQVNKRWCAVIKNLVIFTRAPHSTRNLFIFAQIIIIIICVCAAAASSYDMNIIHVCIYVAILLCKESLLLFLLLFIYIVRHKRAAAHRNNERGGGQVIIITTTPPTPRRRKWPSLSKHASAYCKNFQQLYWK